MNKKDFFVKVETVSLDIFGQEFKYKKVNAGDELNWVNDYTTEVNEPDPNNPKKTIRRRKQDLAKLGKCKLRNVVEIPFTKEELKEITGLDKEFDSYTDKEKDELFCKLHPDIYSALITAIDETKKHKAKN